MSISELTGKVENIKTLQTMIDELTAKWKLSKTKSRQR